MARPPTYYDVLDVLPGVDGDGVRRAYRRTMRLVHPDLAVDASDRRSRELRSRLVNEAYEVLSDPQARAQYDAAIGARAPHARLRFGLRRAARRLFMPRLGGRLERLPRPRAGGAYVGAVLDTRLGQWLLVLGVLGAARLSGSPALPALLLALVLAILLARRGEPTPLADAGAVGLRLGQASTVLAARALTAGVAWLARSIVAASGRR